MPCNELGPGLRRFSGPSDDDSHSPTVVFVHANGYPPESYRTLLMPLAERFTIYTVQHRPLWQPGAAPRTLSWHRYVDDLLSAVEAAQLGRVWLLGHSMGAIISMLAALRQPSAFNGVMAMDPVMLPLGMWLTGQLVTHVFRGEIPIAQVALRRPHEFQSYEAAFAFYRSKRPFRRMSDQALWDYVHAGHAPVPGHGVALRWSGAWEACVYRSAPYMFHRLSRLEIPVLGIAGAESDVLTSSAIDAWRARQAQVEIHVLPGGHLIPLEDPDRCADLIRGFVDRH